MEEKLWETIITTNTEKRQVIAARGFLETQITTTEMERRLATAARGCLALQTIITVMVRRKDIVVTVFLEREITMTVMERRLATIRRTALEIQIIMELMGKRKDIKAKGIKAKGGFKLSGFDSPRVPRSSAAGLFIIYLSDTIADKQTGALSVWKWRVAVYGVRKRRWNRRI